MGDNFCSTVALGNKPPPIPSMQKKATKSVLDPLEELPRRRGLNRQISTSQPKLASQLKHAESIENILKGGGLRRRSLAITQELRRNLSASNLAAYSDSNLSIRKAVPVRSYDALESESAAAKQFFDQLVKCYYYQMTDGCGNADCRNKFCKSSPDPLDLSHDRLALVSIQLAILQKNYLCSSVRFKDRALPKDVFQSKNTKCKQFLQSLYSTSPFQSLFQNGTVQDGSFLKKYSLVSRIDDEYAAKPPMGGASLRAKCSRLPLGKSRELFSKSKLKLEMPNSMFEQPLRSGSVNDLTSSEEYFTWPEIQPKQQHSVDIADDPLSEHSHPWSGSGYESRSTSACGSGDSTQVHFSLGPARSRSSLGSNTALGSASRIFSYGRIPTPDSFPVLDPNTPPFTPSPQPPATPRRLLSEHEALEETDDLREFERSLSIENAVSNETEFSLTHLTLPMLKSAILQYQECNDNSFLLNTIRTVFTSSESLNSSFKVDERSSLSLVDLQVVREAYKLLMTLQPINTFLSVMTNAIEILLMNLKRSTLESNEINQIFILLENPLFPTKPELILVLSEVLANCLSEGGRMVFVKVLASYQKEDFLRLLRSFQSCLSASMKPQQRCGEELLNLAKSIALFYKASKIATKKNNAPLVTIEDFYSEELCRNLDYTEEYEFWSNVPKGATNQLSVLDFPFLLDPTSKVHMLHLNAVMQMRNEYQNAIIQQAKVDQAMRYLKEGYLTTSLQDSLKAAVCPYLILEVRRDNLLQDTLNQLLLKEKDLKKPLKIKFVGGGEQGLDMGGLQKEFFQLIVESVFDPSHGMFMCSDETRLVWFSSSSLELNKEFEVVGIILGLAIYNGVILDIHFPKTLYKKLHGLEVDLGDLQEVQPALAHGLKELLEFDGDIEEIFCQTFQVSYNAMGHQVTADLKKDGSLIPVTQENKEEFVQLYTKYILVTNISRQFEAFAQGFHRVCGGPVLSLFHPTETELLVCGMEELDFKALEEGVTYEDGFNKEHKTIIGFWKVVHAMTTEQKKQLLRFITGSARVPLKGLASLPLVIQRNGTDSDNLPTAMTCFNRLLLPDYATHEKLSQRLLLAIQFSKGFGLS